MPQINHILVPVELDENTVPVVYWGALLARATSARMTLLHVNEALEPIKTRPIFQSDVPPGVTIPMTDLHDTYNRVAQQDLNQLVKQAGEGLSVETRLVEGRAHAAILEYGKQRPYDLIVMGTHGRPWYQRFLLGSTAEAVLRTASVPVLVVRNTAPLQYPLQLKTLLLPTDLSAGSTAGIEWGGFFAQYGGEEVVLVHVVENPLIEVYKPNTIDFNLQQIMEESRQHTPRSAQPFWEHARQVATEELTNLGQQFSGLPVRVEHLTLEGLAADEILTFAAEKGVDLIMMATHGRTGVRHLLLGSVTEKVVRAASCPVLAVRSKE